MEVHRPTRLLQLTGSPGVKRRCRTRITSPTVRSLPEVDRVEDQHIYQTVLDLQVKSQITNIHSSKTVVDKQDESPIQQQPPPHPPASKPSACRRLYEPLTRVDKENYTRPCRSSSQPRIDIQHSIDSSSEVFPSARVSKRKLRFQLPLEQSTITKKKNDPSKVDSFTATIWDHTYHRVDCTPTTTNRSTANSASSSDRGKSMPRRKSSGKEIPRIQTLQVGDATTKHPHQQYNSSMYRQCVNETMQCTLLRI